MNLDFTISSYRQLLQSFKTAGYQSYTFEDYLTKKPEGRVVIFRHDVDEQPGNALKMAQAEHDLGIQATYYFRIVKQSNDPEIIRQIAAMGHEIGYHYEDLSRAKGNVAQAMTTFAKNLDYFRTFYPVRTICMHGSSTSEYDNRTLWKENKMEDYGIIGEPYLSLDFSKVFYLTDTGFAWDGGRFATRDIVENPFGLSFHSSDQVAACVNEGRFPVQSMILSHTLWTDNLFDWCHLHSREYVRNRVKLLSKRNKFIKMFYKKLVSMYWRF